MRRTLINIALAAWLAAFGITTLAVTKPAQAKEVSQGDRRLQDWEAYKAGWNDGVKHENDRIVKGIDAILEERERALVNRLNKSDKDQSRHDK